jgi:hypothetical protein
MIFRQLILVFCLLLVTASSALAHHVLGRPAYSLNEDSNTPPAMQIETQLGDYFITMMVYPAFPKPGESSRVNLYATHLDSDLPYLGEVKFSIRDDVLYGKTHSDLLGKQKPDDNIFRQGFVVPHDGEYVVTAEFQANGEPYSIDFPILIGAPNNIMPVVLAGSVLFIIVGGLALRKRKRLRMARAQSAVKAAQDG